MSDQCSATTIVFRDLVEKERGRQLKKWGPQTHTSAEWMAILMEEVGEAAQAVCQIWIDGGPAEDVMEELVEVAAVAEAAYVDLSEKRLQALYK